MEYLFLRAAGDEAVGKIIILNDAWRKAINQIKRMAVFAYVAKANSN
jgi:hypothetical protein